MAGIYLLPYQQSRNVYNHGVINYLTELKFYTGKWYFWNRFFTYYSQHEFENSVGETMPKSLGFEEEFFAIYRYNKHITFQGIVGLFRMSASTKALSHPQIGSFSDFRDWQTWFIFDITIKPSLFNKKWE